jgi:hypothetical protein
MIFASDPEMYESLFESPPPDEEVDWLIPTSEAEITEIMQMIQEDLAETDVSV